VSFPQERTKTNRSSSEPLDEIGYPSENPKLIKARRGNHIVIHSCQKTGILLEGNSDLLS
jgi:hypothetical protein